MNEREPTATRATRAAWEPGNGGGRDALLPNRSYPSRALWRITRALEAAPGAARVLDLGPTRNANIHFWTERGFGVSCYDLLAHELDAMRTQEITPLSLARDALRRRRLPFEDRTFAAVFGWGVFDQMPFLLAQRYAQECHRVLAPGGLLHAVFLDVDGHPGYRRNYEIVDRQTLRVFSAASAPRRQAANRWVAAEIHLMLSRFSACEVSPSAAAAVEVLAQKAPVPR